MFEEEEEKKKYTTELILYSFLKEQVQPETESVTSSKNSSKVVKVSSSSKPNGSGTVGFFLEESFPDK